jgi:hypothetical protein
MSSTHVRLAILIAILPGVACAYDVPTHQALAERAATASAGLQERLVRDLGLPDGLDALVRNGGVGLTAAGWIEQGAAAEDQPFWRVRHHFHDPLRPWDSAGLTLDTAIPLTLGLSSIVRSQQTFQEHAPGGGTWSWPFARTRFLTALTGRTPAERESALADTLKALGHQTHFVQDATVPAHVRNDMHLLVPLGNGRFYPIDPDWFEDWVEDTRERRPRQFEAIASLPPRRPLALVLHSEHPEAPIPIAGLIDTDQFTDDGPVPPLRGPNAFGAAELTSGNFLSRDTIFTRVRRPDLGVLGAPFLEEVAEGAGRFRLYFPRVAGDGAVEIRHFATEGALYRELRAAETGPLVLPIRTLDARVHEDYAGELLPRAIGYSAGLLDYFFRGRLDADVEVDPLDPALVRLTGVNGSSEPLYEGTLALYADTPAGERVRAAALDPPVVIGIAPDQPLPPARFQPPADAERFVAVYEGTLGLERKRDDFRGAVIGKVLGGVRVEEVFAGGDRWRLRTPLGVFDLPLATATFEDVKWGDGDDVLVARTPLRADPPGFVATYEIVRRPGSVEPMVSGTPPTVELRPRNVVSLAFASAPLVTTIVLDQTIDHRQQIGRWQQTLAAQWTTPANFYETVSVTQTPIAFETLHQQTVAFAASVPIRLDAEHNVELGGADEPYLWDLVDVAADRDGRILGLAVVYLTRPPLAAVSVPWLRLDAAGQPFVATTLPLQPRFPEDASTIWVLVDLGAGITLASTAEPTVTIVSRQASEAPPWGSGGFGTAQFPGAWRHSITTYSGGGRDGQTDEIWEPASLALRASTSGLDASLDARVGDLTLSAAGWFQPEIRDALARAGLGSFDAGEIQQTTQRWSYTCLTSPCNTDANLAGFSVVTRRGAVLQPPAQLVDARRARPAPGGERLVLLGDAFRDGPRPIGSVVAWDAAARRAREAFRVPESFHDLGPHAATGAVLLSFRPRLGPAGTFVVGLEEGAVESFFAGEDLAFDFAVLAPDRLYSVRDFRFYRSEPPLQATPLPARLTTVAGNPVGDYHAIPLP